MKNAVKSTFRSFWDGRSANLMTVGLLQDPEAKKAFGVTDEQHQQIQDAQKMLGATLQEKPEFKASPPESMGKIGFW
jgi:hypothetical protein